MGLQRDAQGGEGIHVVRSHVRLGMRDRVLERSGVGERPKPLTRQSHQRRCIPRNEATLGDVLQRSKPGAVEYANAGELSQQRSMDVLNEVASVARDPCSFGIEPFDPAGFDLVRELREHYCGNLGFNDLV